MKKLTKRVFGLFLALLLLCTMVPYEALTASATGATSQSTITTGDIITYGSYPQTEVTDSALISALNTQTLQGDNTVTYSGSKYKRVHFTQYTDYWSRLTTNPENTYQDDNGYYINTVYWFKYEPLQWRVLSNTNGELFVMAEKILETRAYNQVFTDVTWETCTMRNWLNDDFYNTAFNSTEQAKIKTSNVVNEDNPRHGTTGGNNTNDKLFLLSYSEVINTDYGFSSDYLIHDTDRMAQGTDYAKSNGLWVSTSSSYLGNSTWWLRTPGYSEISPGFACRVSTGGSVDSYGNGVGATYDGARPAFKINLSSDIFTSITVNVKATNASTVAQDNISDATVSLYANGKWIRDTQTDINGNATVSLQGLSPVQIASATISAYKTMESGSAINGTARDALFQYFGKNSDNEILRYEYELRSESIDSSGNWSGVKLSSAINGNINLVLKEPLLKINLAVCYLANDTNSESAEYKQALKDCLSETSKTLAQTTDGHVIINKVLLLSTDNRLNFYDTSNLASMADIRIESRVQEKRGLFGNVSIHSNANVGGFYSSDTVTVNDKLVSKFHNLANASELSGITTFQRIQMGGTEYSWNYNFIKDKIKYAETMTHEIGHYLLSFQDEYMNGNEKDWFPIINPRPQYNNNDVFFGLMDNQHSEIEMSKRYSDYNYLTGSETTARKTMQYSAYGMSCEDQMVAILNEGVEVGGQFVMPVGGYESTYSSTTSETAKTSYDRRADYSYAALDDNNFVFVNTAKNTAATNAAPQEITPYNQSTPTNEKLALVSANGSGTVANITVYPATAGSYYLYLLKTGESTPTEITLTATGGNYTSSVNINTGETGELTLVAYSGGVYLSNQIYVDRSSINTGGSLFTSADNCVNAYVIPASSTSYTFTSNNVALVNGDYTSVNQATYIVSDNGIVTEQGELYSVAAVDADIDFSTLSWFVLQDGNWTKLASDFSTEENMNIGARCDFAGDGLYCLMAKEAANTSLIKITGITGTPSAERNGIVNILFTDSNPTEAIAYYHIYYSESAFTSPDDADVSLKIVYPGENGYNLNLYDAGKTAYVGIIAVGTNGARSPLCEAVLVTGGTADIDSDGIPDWYCDKFMLWGTVDENKDIAISDDDGDYYTNFEEYTRGSDPTNPYDKNIFVTAGMKTVVNWQNNLIYGFETPPATLDGLLAKSGVATLQMIPAQGTVNGTGTVVNVIVADVIVENYRVVVFGDINGDGNIDSIDAGNIVDNENYVSSWDPLIDSAKRKAADLNGDGNIDSIDAGIAVDAENYILTIDQTTGLVA